MTSLSFEGSYEPGSENLNFLLKTIDKRQIDVKMTIFRDFQ